MDKPHEMCAVPFSKAGAGSRRLMAAVVGFAVFLYWMGLYLYVPTLPTYVQSKSDNLALVGVVLAQYGLWQAVVRLPLGIAVAGRVGRGAEHVGQLQHRPVHAGQSGHDGARPPHWRPAPGGDQPGPDVAGIGWGGAGSSAAAALRLAALHGLSQGVGYPVLMGMSIEHVDDARRSTAMSLHQAVYAIGMFTGPWLSGLLADAIGIQPMFGVTAAVCLVVGLVVPRWLVDGSRK